jgi:hypothetical protein
MPRARRELLGAALSYFDGSENRLTELFATVLEAHEGFARALFQRARIELPDGVRFRSFTQRPLAERARPDMVLQALHGQHLLAQLWSEHKVAGGGFRDMQLEDYRDALAKQGSPGALLGVVAEVKAGAEGPDWQMLSWQEVAELANTVGAEWGAASGAPFDWRAAALAPDAPASQRLLHEFIWYVEEENEAVVNPLDGENLQAFRKAAETTIGIVTLLERASQHMRPEFEPDPDSADGAADGSYYWHLFDTPEGSWLTRIQAGGFEGYPELMAASDDLWWSSSSGDPAFGVGYTLDERLYESLAADADWIARLVRADVDVSIYDELVRIFRTKPMADVLGEGKTLEEQARALARWAKLGLSDIGQLAPGHFELPAKRRRRRKETEAGDDDGAGALSTQRVSVSDIENGTVRIPLGTAKGVFPPRPASIEIELRGQTLTAKWDPRSARGAARERSGRLSVGAQALATTTVAGDRLGIERVDGRIRLT